SALHLLFLCSHQPSWQQSHQHSWQQSHQLPGSNLISIPGSNRISFLAAISSASLSCSSGYGGMLSHLDVIRFSAHRAPYSPCFKTWLLSLLPVLSNSVCKKPHLFM
ncbi:unnamed protein product, partial [Staurois parvus]